MCATSIESPAQLDQRLVAATGYPSDLPGIPNMLPSSLLLQPPDLRLAQTEVCVAAGCLGAAQAVCSRRCCCQRVVGLAPWPSADFRLWVLSRNEKMA